MSLLLGSSLEQAGQKIKRELLILGLHFDCFFEALLGVGEIVKLAEAYSEQVEQSGISVYS